MIRGIRKRLIEGSFLLTCRKKIDYYLGIWSRKLFYKTGPVDNKKIFFMTYDSQYSCNLRYISDEIIRQNLPVDIVWSCGKRNAKTFPEEVRTVVRGSYKMFEEMASSKIWFDNALNCVWYGMPKKKEQVYINTWHGSLGIKRLSGNKNWLKKAKRCKKLTDYCISNSLFEEEVYRTTFWPTTPYLRYGHARNDILLQKEKHEEIIEKVREFFEIEDDSKIMLYAPTFRDDGTTSCFDIDFSLLKQNLEKRFGGKWVLLVRMHFKNKSVKLSDEWNEWIKNASGYPNMQELLVATDLGITDYSSWAYDYILTRKPLLIYAPDIDKYNGTRGFYYPLETTPFPISQNNEELEENILNFNMDIYLQKCEEFLNEKGCAETGRAAELIVEKIKEIMDIK